MNTYEAKVFEEIQKWKSTEPTIVAKAMSVVTKPITWIVNKIIPQKAIEGALKASNSVAKLLTDENDILRGGKVTRIDELRIKELQISDNLANNVHNWANSLAATEGGITGYLGLPGMAVDIPTIITFALRTIHKIGLCYGYKATTPEDMQFVYAIMSAAGSNSMEEKNGALLTIRELEVIVQEQTWKKIAEKAAQKKVSNEFFLKTIKDLAKQLGINLTKRKVVQALPFIGAVVGSTMNASFINDISWAARRCFQERWLRENGKWIE